jgi:hypothetical protein
MNRRALLKWLAALVAAGAVAQKKDSQPKPPRTDLPYLLQADKLLPTDITTATRSKDDQVITLNGATSTARTPLPEPIFLFSSGQISASQFELFHFQISNGHREWKKGGQERPDNDAPEDTIRLTLRPVQQNVTRIEAAEMLAPGEYALIPRGQTTAFCFTVY